MLLLLLLISKRKHHEMSPLQDPISERVFDEKTWTRRQIWTGLVEMDTSQCDMRMDTSLTGEHLLVKDELILSCRHVRTRPYRVIGYYSVRKTE
jgi:hypothetical protein